MKKFPIVHKAMKHKDSPNFYGNSPDFYFACDSSISFYSELELCVKVSTDWRRVTCKTCLRVKESKRKKQKKGSGAPFEGGSRVRSKMNSAFSF